MKNNTDIPEEVFNKIMLYNSHPLADLFKKELDVALKSNKLWLGYFRKSYKQFMRTAPIENVERYSRNLAYWYIQLEMEKTEPKMNYLKNVEPKRKFIKSEIIRLMNRIRNIFSSDILPTINQRAMDIKNNYLLNINGW